MHEAERVKVEIKWEPEQQTENLKFSFKTNITQVHTQFWPSVSSIFSSFLNFG